MIRDAVALGIPPEDALVMASLSPALYHGLDHLGAIATFPLSKVLDASRGINGAAQALGATFPAPFQMLAFLALSVIPSLKITDHGLLDVDRCELVPLAVDGLVELQPSRLATPASATHA